MSYKSRSSVALLAAMMVFGCAKRHDHIILVDSKDYGSRFCWFDRSGGFAAFLVLAQNGRVVVPYPVSARCMVNGKYTSDAEAILHHLNAIRLVDSDRVLARKLPGTVVANNLKSEQSAPSPESKVYYTTAKLVKIRHYYEGVYRLERIDSMEDTGISFGNFLEMSIDDREKLRNDKTRLRKNYERITVELAVGITATVAKLGIWGEFGGGEFGDSLDCP
ncbi:MAG: hypothetical protein ACJ770_05080 [Gemmatimonadaceae bacterium]